MLAHDSEQTRPEKEISNPDTMKPAEPAGSRKKTVLFIAFSIIFTILLTTITVLYLLYLYVPYDASEMTRIKEKAAQTWDIVNSISTKDNGWFQYEKAMAQFRSGLTDKETEKLEQIQNNGLKPGDLVFMENLKKKNKAILALVEEGYGKPEFQVPVYYAKGFLDMRDPNFLEFMKLTRFLGFLGDYERQKGNNSEACRRYLQVLHMGQGMSRNGYLVRMIFYTASENDSLQRLRSFLNETDEEAPFYKNLVAEMERIDKGTPTLREIFEYELALGEFTIEEVRKTGKNPFFGIAYSSSSNNVPKMFQDDVYIRDQKVANCYFQALSMSDNGNFKETFDAFQREYRVRINTRRWPEPPNDYSGYVYTLYKTRAEYNGVKILAGLKWYRKEKSEYPDSLSALVPGYLKALPKDPFAANTDFIYKKDGDSILLYSIGPDLRDDGGKTISNDLLQPGDIVFNKAGSRKNNQKSQRAEKSQEIRPVEKEGDKEC